MREERDYIIVGAGLAGLHTGIRLKKKYPQATVTILERFGYTGGRVVTYKHNVPGYGKVQWENGAGRIHRHNHPLVMKYLRRYSLTFSPIGDELEFKDGAKQRPSIFEKTYLPMIESILSAASDSEKRNHTIRELLIQIVGAKKTAELVAEFPYDSEIDTLRADWALEVFRGEMSSSSGFGVCKEGLSALIECMVKEFESLGGEILERHRVSNIDVNEQVVEVLKGPSFVASKAIILALHVSALRELPFLRGAGLPLLNRVAMRPLLRTYGVFEGTPFKGLNKVVEADGIRYFIPMGPSVAMVSYTDGPYAEKWMRVLEKEGEDVLCKKIMAGLRKLLWNDAIPEPLFFKAHPWKEGCSYWVPGNYDVRTASVEAHTPFPGKPIFICGESFSLRQAWMEGAIEHADSLFENVVL